MAKIINLHVDQGSDYRHTFRYRQPDGTTPISLSGFTLRAHVRASIWSDDTLYVASTEDTGLTITDASDGTFVFSIPGSSSSAWLVDQAVYDIELVDGSNKPLRIVQGYIYINREVTR